MKILFIKPYQDPYNPTRIYQPGWVAEFTDPDAQRAIIEGVAEPAPEGAFSRKGAAPIFECAVPLEPPFKPISEKINLNDIPEAAKQESRRKESGFFGKK